METQPAFSALLAFQSWCHLHPFFALVAIFSAVVGLRYELKQFTSLRHSKQTLCYQTWKTLYRIYFHPLARFPGPKFAAASHLPVIFHLVNGDNHTWHSSLHRQYGDVVRTGPSTLSYCNAAAWKDIYGFRKDAKFIKDPEAYGAPPNGVPGLLSANDENHARFRRIFSHAFSDRALKEQEPLFMQYLNLLVQKLDEKVAANPDVEINMVNMLNFTTFDIMADLTFGAPLGMLAKSEYHPWVSLTFAALKFGTMVRAITFFPFLKKAAAILLPGLKKKREEHFRFSSEQVDSRLQRKSDKPDIWNLVLQADESRALNIDEMHSNGALFMGAGTETTATELSGALYYLITNSSCMTKLKDEIRTAFPGGSEDITIDKLAQLKYLHACLEEGLRIYPPVPIGLPRAVPYPGATIMGTYIPGGMRVSVSQFGTYHSPRNFALPDEYHPERWLPSSSPDYDARFERDEKSALQPFSIGPRNCLGKNLAYHEMKLVLATLVLNFDFELCEESKGWSEQRIYALWEKKPLLVRLKPVKR